MVTLPIKIKPCDLDDAYGETTFSSSIARVMGLIDIELNDAEDMNRNNEGHPKYKKQVLLGVEFDIHSIKDAMDELKFTARFKGLPMPKIRKIIKHVYGALLLDNKTRGEK